jgi:glutamine---fructose-6-phosphate transaminase (isomerizing)
VRPGRRLVERLLSFSPSYPELVLPKVTLSVRHQARCAQGAVERFERTTAVKPSDGARAFLDASAKAAVVLGKHFEREIREQPRVWRNIAESQKAQTLAHAIAGSEVVLLGSGSSLFMAALGALTLRRRGIRAHALAATEAPLDHAAYRGAVAIACSQSGESDDLLEAIEILKPATLIALTNSSQSTLAERATLTIDVGAGTEIAIPASKSVTATAAILLWAAGILAGRHARSARSLEKTAQDVSAWLDGEAVDRVREAAKNIAHQRSVIIVGTGYGLPIAYEAALKMKEASYVHAEGFSAGEFRHGSAAILDASCALLGIVDDVSRRVVEQPIRAALDAGSSAYSIGGTIDGLKLLGPVVDEAFNTLAWLVTAQMIALETGRARGIDSDAPRGQSKVLGTAAP